MTRPRAELVSLSNTPYYHCMGRCVRRAFLCGEDAVTGRSFTHRRQWILDRLNLLTATFAMDLCAYALMSNHYHLVVRIDSARAEAWSDQEVVERWTSVYSRPKWARRFLEGETLTPEEEAIRDERVPLWRTRLSDLSWFMGRLNEWFARRANKEDGCKGHFWEARFHSQALLDEAALLTSMVYVDLNPIRAGVAQTPIDSDFTSLQQRLIEMAEEAGATLEPQPPKPPLAPFADAKPPHGAFSLPINRQDYLDLVDASGRIVRDGKRGRIPENAPPLLTPLGVDPGAWFNTVTGRQPRQGRFLGSPHQLQQVVEQRGWHWVWGITASRHLYRYEND